MFQRRTALLHTSLKVKRDSFAQTADHFAHISPMTMHAVVERIAAGDMHTTYTAEEQCVKQLLPSVNSITQNVPGSSSSVAVKRNEI